VPAKPSSATQRVSVVKYLNTAPLIWGLERGPGRKKYELAFTTPAGCAEDLRTGRAEIGIIPSIEYQRIEGLKVLAGISIASKRRVRSVLLLAQVPIEQVRSVALDTSSRTSAALVQILFRKFYGMDVMTLSAEPDPNAMLLRADAALLIGDPALVYQGPAQMIDLAAEWRKFTGLPFVFAVWACRSGEVYGSMDDVRRDFERARDEGFAHIPEIALEWGPRLGLAAGEVSVYLTENIDYTLDEENLAGLRLFYKLAAEAGVIPAVKDLDFA
jgi:chorismate dehydratase